MHATSTTPASAPSVHRGGAIFLRLLAYPLFLASGAAGLIYEVVWTAFCSTRSGRGCMRSRRSWRRSWPGWPWGRGCLARWATGLAGAAAVRVPGVGRGDLRRDRTVRPAARGAGGPSRVPDVRPEFRRADGAALRRRLWPVVDPDDADGRNAAGHGSFHGPPEGAPGPARRRSLRGQHVRRGHRHVRRRLYFDRHVRPAADRFPGGFA